MRGPRIPVGQRIINDVPPVNPSDFGEANADHLMNIFDHLGDGSFLQDASILMRCLANLFAREQLTPNLTLEILAGVGWFGTNFVTFAGGNSPTIPAPIGNPRRDIVALKSDGTIAILSGTPAASPVAPTVPSGYIPIAQVFCRVGMTQIHDNDTQVAGQGFIEFDLRPINQQIVGGAVIKSVQRGTGTLNLTNPGGGSEKIEATANVTITSVDTTKSFRVVDFDLPVGSGVPNGDNVAVRSRISSSTNLEIKISSDVSASATLIVSYSWEVIEFN